MKKVMTLSTKMTTIRFPEDVYEKLKKQAAAKHISINQMVVESVQQFLEESATTTSTMESRLILNQVVKPDKIFADSGLVSVNGIYYRYLTSDNQAIQADMSYLVVEAVGNILTIKPIQK